MHNTYYLKMSVSYTFMCVCSAVKKNLENSRHQNNHQESDDIEGTIMVRFTTTSLSHYYIFMKLDSEKTLSIIYSYL